MLANVRRWTTMNRREGLCVSLFSHNAHGRSYSCAPVLQWVLSVNAVGCSFTSRIEAISMNQNGVWKPPRSGLLLLLADLFGKSVGLVGMFLFWVSSRFRCLKCFNYDLCQVREEHLFIQSHWQDVNVTTLTSTFTTAIMTLIIVILSSST